MLILTQDGVRGCGWQTALHLTRYGLGNDLLHSATDEKAPDLASYARTWANELRMVLTRDPDGYIGRRCQCIAEAIPEDFPDPTTILAYVAPITSDMETAIELLGAPQNTDIRRLAFLCEFHFGWSRYQHPHRAKSLESTGMLGKLQSLVFEGIYLWSLYLVRFPL
jgi:Holliday junction resolvase YEN1